MVFTLTCSLCNAQQTNAPTTAAPAPPVIQIPLYKMEKIPVEVNVTAGDFTDILKSYICRELRKLGDVSVVDTNKGMLSICCTALKTRALNGINTGYAISYCTSSQADSVVTIWKMNNLGISSDIIVKSGITDVSPGTFRNQYLAVCGINDLQSEVEEDIARIDSDDIDPLRKLFKKESQ